MKKKLLLTTVCAFSLSALVGCSSMLASAMNMSVDMLADEALNGKYPLPTPTNIAWNQSTAEKIQNSMQCNVGLDWQDKDIKKVFPLTLSSMKDKEGSIWVASAVAPQGFTVYGLPVSKIQIVMTDGIKNENYTRVQRYQVITTESMSVVDKKLEEARKAHGGEKLRQIKDENNVLSILTTSSSKNQQDTSLINIDCTVNTMNKNPLPPLK